MPPPRTAATTAALRRTTHLLVLRGGRLSMSRARLDGSSKSVSIWLFGEAEGRTSDGPGAVGNRCSWIDGGIPWRSRSTSPIPSQGDQFPTSSRFFDDFRRVCH